MSTPLHENPVGVSSIELFFGAFALKGEGGAARAIVSASKRRNIGDSGISLDVRGKNGFYSAFSYQS